MQDKKWSLSSTMKKRVNLLKFERHSSKKDLAKDNTDFGSEILVN